MLIFPSLLPDFLSVEVFIQPHFIALVLHIFHILHVIHGTLVIGGLCAEQEWARKDPPYFGATFGASGKGGIVYALPDLELPLTELTVSTVLCFVFVDWHFTSPPFLSKPNKLGNYSLSCHGEEI
jgi:hypothetical protein